VQQINIQTIIFRAFSSFGVSALCFLQCLDTAGWVTGRTSSP